MRIHTVIFFLIIGFPLLAQHNYNSLVAKGEYEKITEFSKQLKTQEDYYWQASMLNKRGKSLQAIELLSQWEPTSDSSHRIERLLAKLLYETGQYKKACQRKKKKLCVYFRTFV